MKKSTFLIRVWRSWQHDLTDSGKAMVIGGIIALSIGSFSTLVDTYVLSAFIGLYGFLALNLALFNRPNTRLTHTLPHRAVAGEKVRFSLKLKNLSTRVAWDVIVHSTQLHPEIEITPREQFLPKLGGDDSAELHFKAYFRQRGSFYFPGFRADTTFPFGLFRIGGLRQRPASVLVYPWFFPLSHLQIPTGRRYQPGGVALASEIGDSVEYIGNREYHQGDRLRDIDWRSSARLGKPVVREYQEEYFCRVALVLDTYLNGEKFSPNQARFEASLSLAAAIADYLSHQEYLIDIFAAGPKIYILEAGRALAHLEQVLEVLACLDPSPQDAFSAIEPVVLDHISQLTTIIIILLTLDSSRLAFLERVLALGVGVKVVLCHAEAPASAILPPFASNSIDWQTVTPAQVQHGIARL